MANIVVVGAQWGDEGKGKIVDILSEFADIVVRYQGGNNAGHTVVIGEEKFILHLIPTGIFYPGKRCVIGNGVVIDPEGLIKEIETLSEAGYFKDDSLLISERAHLIMPYHKKLDSVREQLKERLKIGTTKRGIGPAYEDKVARIGILCGDLLREEGFKEKLEANLLDKNRYFKEILHEEGYEVSKIYDKYMDYAARLKDYITDTSLFLNNSIREGKSILFEGAQGTFLDVDHGTYPYVTSSNASTGGVCSGTGVGPTHIDKVVGVSKAYTTRVGEGPFPTEVTGEAGEAFREMGGEFGATTGRERRCGWFDVVGLRYSVRVNGMSGVILTKLDVLDSLDKIPVCVAYEYKGERIKEFPYDIEVLEGCKPVYEELDGWKEKTNDIKDFDKLPQNAKRYIRRIEELIDTEVIMLSLGAKRKEAIILKNPF
ncbi:MAG: adenylosuccinate synthase [Thermodesulfobacteriota bacterium]